MTDCDERLSGYAVVRELFGFETYHVCMYILCLVETGAFLERFLMILERFLTTLERF